MPQPSFISEGTQPRLTDTRWSILVKWLGTLQNQAGAIALNNPTRFDTRRILLGKINSALAGVTFPADSCCDGGQIASYDCVDNVCVDPGDGTGAFGSLAECEAADCGGIGPFEPSFNCVDGVCVEVDDGSGTYATLEECEIACDVTPSWNCVEEGLCVDPGDGTGEFSSLIECQEACCLYCGDEFETYAIGDVTGDTDLDDGCCWIGAWNLASDPILTAGIEEFTEYPDGPAGVLNGGTGFTDAWVIS